MKQFMFSTGVQRSPLFLRIFLAIVLFPHGAQKLLGWFGGYGFEASMKYFTESAGLPWIVGFAVILLEFLGPLALLIGFATRGFSIAIMFLVIGIIATSHSEYFFMNWFGNQPVEGMEYFLLMAGMSLSLAISGAGRYSIDSLLNARNKETFKGTFALTGARI